MTKNTHDILIYFGFGLVGAGLVLGRDSSIVGVVIRTGMFLVCFWALKDALWPLRNLRLPHRRAIAIAAILGMTWAALSIYKAFGTFQSLVTLTAFYFVESLIGAAAIGILIAGLGGLGPKGIKIVLVISGVLFSANDLIVISRHQLMRFITTNPFFGSINGSLMGLAVSLAIILWLAAGKTAEDKQVTE